MQTLTETRFRHFLDARGFNHIELVFPSPEYCTDNAAMIGWTGCEMYEAGWSTSLACLPLAKWSLDERSPDRGILGASDWVNSNQFKSTTSD